MPAIRTWAPYRWIQPSQQDKLGGHSREDFQRLLYAVSLKELSSEALINPSACLCFQVVDSGSFWLTRTATSPAGLWRFLEQVPALQDVFQMCSGWEVRENWTDGNFSNDTNYTATWSDCFGVRLLVL